MSAFDTYLGARDSTLRNGERARAEAMQNQDRNALMEAGKLYSEGDPTGASNLLARSGQLNQAMQIDNRVAQADQQYTTQRLADDARAKTEVLGYAQGLLRMPEDQWAPTFTTQIAPKLTAMGIPQTAIDQVAADGLTRQEVEYFISTLGGEVQRPSYQAAGGGQFMRTDPYSNGQPEFIQAPVSAFDRQKQEAEIVALQALARQRDASGQAATVRASRSGRAAGGRTGGGSSRPAATRPSGGGNPWDRDY